MNAAVQTELWFGEDLLANQPASFNRQHDGECGIMVENSMASLAQPAEVSRLLQKHVLGNKPAEITHVRDQFDKNRRSLKPLRGVMLF